MLFLPVDFAGGVRLRSNASRTPLVPVGPRRIAGREALEGDVHLFQRHDDGRDVAIDMWSLRLEEKIAVAEVDLRSPRGLDKAAGVVVRQGDEPSARREVVDGVADAASRRAQVTCPVREGSVPWTG